ncbi:MAG: DUF2336 domain-containing protein [Rhizomicrobium sp.]
MGNRKSLGQRLLPLLEQTEILHILQEQNEAARRYLAGRPDAAPEVLFYLATEGSPATRRAVAANPATPAHADRLLADDADDDVRMQLARKIGQLMPNLPAEASRRLRELTLETLERLARDQLPRVRQILAEEIKTLDCVPKHVIKMLARDIEAVSAPILEYSPLLSDADLIEIISTAQASYALLAIAKRKPLRPSVADALATALDVPAVAALLMNSGARIRNQTLDKIVQHAENIRDWHLPLVLRNDLSQRAIRRIAGFVSAALIEKLAARQGLDEKTHRHLKQRLHQRIEADDDPTIPVWTASKPHDLAALREAGKLDDTFMENAVEQGQREAVIAALALLAEIAPEIAARIFQTGSAKPITALVWRAGLSMRVAFKIQTALLHLPACDLLPARGGICFPMSEDEMRWHLDYFGISA